MTNFYNYDCVCCYEKIFTFFMSSLNKAMVGIGVGENKKRVINNLNKVTHTCRVHTKSDSGVVRIKSRTKHE